MAADLEAITAIRSAYVTAINAEDADAVSALYTDDAIRMEDNMPAVAGRAAIAEGFRQLTAAWDCDMSLNSEETVVAGNWAYDRGQFGMHMMPKTPGPQMIVDQGKYLVILHKQADGAWKIAREIGNSNVPRPEPQAAPATPAAPVKDGPGLGMLPPI